MSIFDRSHLAAALACIAMMTVANAASAAPDAAGCQKLTGQALAQSEIGLPSGGAKITASDTAMIAASPLAPTPAVEYCKVLGAIAPVDPAASAILFQVNLPLAWNGKAVQYGGGGFNGVLITGLDALRDAPADLATPVARGYMTYGTDSGHQAANLPEIMAFALNDEALVNFAYAAYKKTRDAALRIAELFYARRPAKLYFFGGSEGGREGLTMAQRFPADFDGVVSVVPVINWVGLQSAGNGSGIVQQNGGWMNAAKVATLRKAVVEACDALDGLADGVVSRYESCVKVFDPRKLRCANGRDAGDSCLSDAQLAAVETLHRPYEFNFALANGVRSYPGWNYGGEDQPDGMLQWVMGPRPAAFPLPAPETQGRQWYFGSGAVRYFIARDSKYNSLDYSPDAFVERVKQISELMDSTNPDLSAFAQRGGKLILKENGADFAQSPFQGVEYYKSVVNTMGQANVDRFVRFYVTPGVNHGGAGVSSLDGAPVPRGIDLLGAIDNWAESGNAPDVLVQTAHATAAPFVVTATRPLCRYPAFPKYKGAGSPREAASFTCAVE